MPGGRIQESGDRRQRSKGKNIGIAIAIGIEIGAGIAGSVRHV
jgi:hypothetical protein